MRKTKKVNKLDAFLVGFGSIVQICPMTDAAKDWLEANTQAEGWNWMGRVLCVEARYAPVEPLSQLFRRNQQLAQVVRADCRFADS